ncbi:DNA-directed RNA polymerase subunit B, partial [Candidatus Woesearchaeota archaeon]|nr:DNA-directed RNA polymerase subunit B [Candidatus Woesearchaeota archaeon]
MADLYLNGKFVGTVDDALSFIEEVKDYRRKGKLSENVGVSFIPESGEVYLWCDEGRARRPLIIVRDGKSLLTEKHVQQLKQKEITWMDLVRQGVIESLDAFEEENALVAMTEEDITPEHTHLEISPCVISGVATSLVPFANYNQSSRLIIGSKNQK